MSGISNHWMKDVDATVSWKSLMSRTTMFDYKSAAVFQGHITDVLKVLQTTLLGAHTYYITY